MWRVLEIYGKDIQNQGRDYFVFQKINRILSL